MFYYSNMNSTSSTFNPFIHTIHIQSSFPFNMQQNQANPIPQGPAPWPPDRKSLRFFLGTIKWHELRNTALDIEYKILENPLLTN